MLLLRFLAAIASLHIWLGRILAAIYAKVWSRLKLRWFDHRFDHLRGPLSWYWQERGVLGSRLIKPGNKVLDLGCGEGFYDRLYFSGCAGHVDALDFDPSVIRAAMSRNTTTNERTNIKFYTRDVVQDAFPDANYDVVLCFSALQQLTEPQRDTLFRKIRVAMNPGGVFSGSVSVTPDDKFLSGEQIRSEFVPHFRSVDLNSSLWPGGRVEWYFECRDPLPLGTVQDVRADKLTAEQPIKSESLLLN